MKIIRCILLLTTFFYVVQSSAAIVSMEELYDPVSGQAVILAGDIHTIVEKKPQHADQLIAFAKKYNPLCLLERSKLHEEVQKKEKRVKKLVNAPDLISPFYDACKQHNEIISFEFRDAVFRLMPYIFKYLNNSLFIPGLKKSLGTNERVIVAHQGVHTDIGTADSFFEQIGLIFAQMKKESNAQLQELKGFKKQLKDNPQANRMLISIYKDLFAQVKGKREQLKKMPIKGASESDVAYGIRVAEFLHADISDKNNGQCLWMLVQEVDNHLLEANALRYIFMNKDKNKKIFVLIGAFHTQWISESLQKLGYVSKNAISNTQALKKRQNELRNRSLQDKLNDTSLSEFTVDINAFLAKCTTLEAPKKEPVRSQEPVKQPAALTTCDLVKIGLGIGLATAGIWGLYKYYSKK